MITSTTESGLGAECSDTSSSAQERRIAVACRAASNYGRAVSPANSSYSAEDFEAAYERISPLTPSLSTRAEKAANRQWWTRSGTAGSTWLVQRLRTETNYESCAWVAGLLVSIGARAIPVIIEELERGTRPLALQAILWAMARIPSSALTHGEKVRLSIVLARYASAEDPDLVEAAIETLRAHPAPATGSLAEGDTGSTSLGGIST